MKTGLLSLSDLDARQIAAWRRLATDALEPNPFFEDHFVLPASHLLGEAPALLVVSSADGSEWSFCLPVVRKLRWRRVPAGRCTVGWRHLYSFLGTPLLSRSDPEAALEAVIGWNIRRHSGGFLGMDLVGTGGAFSSALAAATARASTAPVVYEVRQRAALRRRADGAYLAINRKHQREVARQARRLGEQLGSELALRDRTCDDQAVARFLELEESGWKGSEGTALASQANHRELFVETCAGFAAEGRLRLLSYEADGRSVAMLCTLLAGDSMFLFKTAYDESLARFSPGIQLLVAVIESFDTDPGLQMIDSCAEPGNEMINRLWAGRRDVEALAMPVPGPRGALAARAIRATSRLTSRER